MGPKQVLGLTDWGLLKVLVSKGGAAGQRGAKQVLGLNSLGFKGFGFDGGEGTPKGSTKGGGFKGFGFDGWGKGRAGLEGHKGLIWDRFSEKFLRCAGPRGRGWMVVWCGLAHSPPTPTSACSQCFSEKICPCGGPGGGGKGKLESQMPGQLPGAKPNSLPAPNQRHQHLAPSYVTDIFKHLYLKLSKAREC